MPCPSPFWVLPAPPPGPNFGYAQGCADGDVRGLGAPAGLGVGGAWTCVAVAAAPKAVSFRLMLRRWRMATSCSAISLLMTAAMASIAPGVAEDTPRRRTARRRMHVIGPTSATIDRRRRRRDAIWPASARLRSSTRLAETSSAVARVREAVTCPWVRRETSGSVPRERAAWSVVRGARAAVLASWTVSWVVLSSAPAKPEPTRAAAATNGRAIQRFTVAPFGSREPSGRAFATAGPPRRTWPGARRALWRGPKRIRQRAASLRRRVRTRRSSREGAPPGRRSPLPDLG